MTALASKVHFLGFSRFFKPFENSFWSGVVDILPYLDCPLTEYFWIESCFFCLFGIVTIFMTRAPLSKLSNEIGVVCLNSRSLLNGMSSTWMRFPIEALVSQTVA